MDKKPNIEKVKEQPDKDVVNELLKMKKAKESYADILRRLLRDRKGMT
jgi:predicted CopG family antitoxin